MSEGQFEKRINEMERTHNILFITFQLARQNKELEVRCCGCREIVIPDYKKPVHIKGLMDFNHRYIPVVDPVIHFCGKSTPMTDSTCIMVVNHDYEYRELETAILIRDIDEIMNLVAGSYTSAAPEGASYNVRFILGLLKNVEAGRFLTDCHLSMSNNQRQKHLDEDFVNFKDIMSRGLAYA